MPAACAKAGCDSDGDNEAVIPERSPVAAAASDSRILSIITTILSGNGRGGSAALRLCRERHRHTNQCENDSHSVRSDGPVFMLVRIGSNFPANSGIDSALDRSAPGCVWEPGCHSLYKFGKVGAGVTGAANLIGVTGLTIARPNSYPCRKRVAMSVSHAQSGQPTRQATLSAERCTRHRQVRG